MLGYESFGRFLDGVCKFEGKFGWVMSFLEKKIIFPSALVPGVNNDQSLTFPSSQGSCRPSPKHNRRLFQNKNKVNRANITATEHTLKLNILIYSHLVDRTVLTLLTECS